MREMPSGKRVSPGQDSIPGTVSGSGWGRCSGRRWRKGANEDRGGPRMAHRLGRSRAGAGGDPGSLPAGRPPCALRPPAPRSTGTSSEGSVRRDLPGKDSGH